MASKRIALGVGKMADRLSSRTPPAVDGRPAIRDQLRRALAERIRAYEYGEVAD